MGHIICGLFKLDCGRSIYPFRLNCWHQGKIIWMVMMSKNKVITSFNTRRICPLFGSNTVCCKPLGKQQKFSQSIDVKRDSTVVKKRWIDCLWRTEINIREKSLKTYWQNAFSLLRMIQLISRWCVWGWKKSVIRSLQPLMDLWDSQPGQKKTRSHSTRSNASRHGWP